MNKILKSLGVAVLTAAAVSFPAFADTCTEGNTGLSISPVTKVLNIEGGKSYDTDVFTVKNISSEEASFRVYAAPYSASDENYNMSFSNETKYTQISRWISFKDKAGNYVNEATFTVPGCTEETISYKIDTPYSIPNGGQYAVIFAEGINNSNGGGIKAVSRVGLVIYGRATGETINTAEISGLTILKNADESLNSKDGKKITNAVIHASAVVKNTGNVDINTRTTVTVKNIFGGELYKNTANTSVLPDSTRKIVDVWEETPYFGLFWVSYSVNAANASEEITQLVLMLPLPILVVILVLVAVVVFWIIVMVKKRRERKSRYMV